MVATVHVHLHLKKGVLELLLVGFRCRLARTGLVMSGALSSFDCWLTTKPWGASSSFQRHLSPGNPPVSACCWQGLRSEALRRAATPVEKDAMGDRRLPYSRKTLQRSPGSTTRSPNLASSRSRPPKLKASNAVAQLCGKRMLALKARMVNMTSTP